jgi:N-acetylglucosaminyldiphosphoundecaprenol N-acetyl-beta-D-mannosaminyltransferase
MESSQIERLNVLGVNVSGIDLAMAIAEIDRWIRHGCRSYVTLLDVHGVMEAVHNQEVQRAYNGAGLVLPDGMPLVWLLWRGGFPSADRVCGPDLLPAVFNHFQQAGYRHFLYGATARTLELLEGNLTAKFPAAKVVGTHAPPFRPAGAKEDEPVIEAINASAADIVWVGLSTPKQELWMTLHRHRLYAPVLIGVGAAFDLHAGLLRRAPRWLQRTGLEWAFRMSMEPRRLAKRYLRNNPAFLGLLAAEKLGVSRTASR